MTPKEYLMGVSDLNKKINYIISDRKALRQSQIRAVDLTRDYIKSNEVNKPTERTTMKIIEYEDKLNHFTDELILLKIKIANEISKLNDFKSRDILRQRYIHCRSMKEIAADTDMTTRHIGRIHNRALEEFKEVHRELFILDTIE